MLFIFNPYPIYHFWLDTTTPIVDNLIMEENNTPLSPVPDVDNQVATPPIAPTPPTPEPIQPPTQPIPAPQRWLVILSVIILAVAIILVAFKLILKNKTTTPPEPTPTTLSQPTPSPTPLSTEAPAEVDDPTAEGKFCGGIAANLPENQCPEGFSCKLDGKYPDAGGVCTKN
ncbi:MAG: hypothetical protein ABIJ85_04950 [bacterium]